MVNFFYVFELFWFVDVKNNFFLKYYFDAFSSKIYFKKQPLPHFQTHTY
jgi:hypothetical protein